MKEEKEIKLKIEELKKEIELKTLKWIIED